MLVLVTGGLGFVGQAVTRNLAQHGHHVVALTRDAGGRPVPAGVDVASADVTSADVTDRTAIAELVRRGSFDAVCH